MAGDELETSVLGIPIKARGINTIGMVMTGCALAASMWLLYDRTTITQEQLAEVQITLAVRADEHREMMVVLRQMMVSLTQVMDAKASTAVALNEQNYIILTEGAERERIKKGLSMPQSLRDKINR